MNGETRSSPWIPLLLLAVGAAAVVLLAVADTLRQRSAVDDARQLQALEEIAAAVAISHLWLEEYVTGDAVDESEIAGRLDHALHLLDGMIGSRAEDTAPPLHTADLRRSAAEMRAGLEEFRALAEERRQGYQRGLPVGIGSPLDVEYDREFETLLTARQRLRTALEAHQRDHQTSSRQWLTLIVVGWGLLLVGAAVALWRRGNRQRRAEHELAESRRQLLQTQKMEVAGRVAGGLTHDLANYLAAIRGHCEWVRLKHPEPERLDRKMDSVLRTVDRATDLVDRLLAFARPRPLRDEQVDLDLLVRNIEEMVESSLGDGIELVVRSTPGLWSIRGDRAQLEQAIVNLVLNARDASAAGDTVTVSLANQPRGSDTLEDRDAVELRVIDQGTGIELADLERIFEPFWSTKEGGGTGLGLAVVYGVVQQHGGRLEVDSEPDRGTTFRWLIPRG